MGNEYRTEKKILASELFDGRLKNFGIHEHDRGHSDRNYRCLSDGEKRLGVPINEAGYITGFASEWNGDWSAPEKILSAVSDAFQTKIFRYGEPEYHGFESEEEKAAWASKQKDVERWLAIRKEAALKIDPTTPEVEWWYAETLDPYGVHQDLPEEYQQVGREYFACAPGSDVWVNSGDLPQEVHDALWNRHKSKLAFPAGLDLVWPE
jgi:hypothetical protein